MEREALGKTILIQTDLEQRDYIMKQVDQLGRVLARALSNLLGLKSQGDVSSGIEIVNEALKGELYLDIEKLIAIRTDAFIAMLKEERNFSNENLDSLADILLLEADNITTEQGKNDKRKMLYEKCLTIHQYLEKSEATYSIDRHLKIERIKKMVIN